jgi:hypothetical protein
MATVKGIDLAIDSGRFITDLTSAGIAFVGRYYRSPSSRWPALSLARRAPGRSFSPVTLAIIALKTSLPIGMRMIQSRLPFLPFAASKLRYDSTMLYLV